MEDQALAQKLLGNHNKAAAALIAVILKNLPDDVRMRTLEAAQHVGR